MNQISFDEFDQWASSSSEFIREHAFFNDAVHFDDGNVAFFHGDQAIENIRIAPVTVIDGNLTTDRISREFDTGLLVVTGNLHCMIFDAGIDVVVGGNLIAHHVCVNSHNDYSLIVAGDLIAASFLECGHQTIVHGCIRSPIIVALMNEVTAHGGMEGDFFDHPEKADLPQIFAKDVIDSSGYFDEERYMSYLRQGQNPLALT